jgi:aspartate carbamoyltransferase catalytic subunit
MEEKLGDLKGKRVVIVGDIAHSRVARSNIHVLKKLGASVAVSGPAGCSRGEKCLVTWATAA